ncbi:transcriptional regulator of arginine metabolism [Actinobaculum suis]|uniref:Arginine repressor n=1 Tax=Actinobaculum suis TaxID=1657 RepID=A0A0K9ESK4_9ACTO|nr:arginine repressor [Actinobaculum suis]KMY23164.1 ArgR family transcriptional regulator [Actinobaculum suis]MDY5153723.1 arginine repressor [Actinobaculum suis]OCA94495.1 arginine repressor [Actinobaculum suis]OCA94967.1 arginine repressor [Actinobaculum suis]SDE26643.1 transcriptional regulator of arginine metabolism [Actinobaculum suis]
MNIPATRAARQGLISDFLDSHQVRSQNDLRQLLAAEGVDVTQATLSRDLDELGAVKTKVDGVSVYKIPDSPDSEARGQLARWAREIMTSARYSLNQIVLRTPPGAAQLLASGVDRAHFPGVLGCIAGDDTVLVVTESEERAQNLTEHLLNLA